MKIGVIGLGTIAQKAYLPIYSELRDQATFILATRNRETRHSISQKYGFSDIVETVDELIQKEIVACFVHVATAAHVLVVRKLLEAGVHVFVDKPLSEQPTELAELQQLAENEGLILMVGFNRRFAPFVEKLKQVDQKNMLFVQKNRVASEYSSRFVIYDLFLHVVDTIVYLLDDELISVKSKIVEENGNLQRAVLTIETPTTTAVGTMNLFSGANTESIQLFSNKGTYLLDNLTELTTKTTTTEYKETFGDWRSTLEKRGFKKMIEAFLKAVLTGELSEIKQNNIYLSHELCEKMLLNCQKNRV